MSMYVYISFYTFFPCRIPFGGYISSQNRLMILGGSDHVETYRNSGRVMLLPDFDCSIYATRTGCLIYFRMNPYWEQCLSLSLPHSIYVCYYKCWDFLYCPSCLRYKLMNLLSMIKKWKWARIRKKMFWSGIRCTKGGSSQRDKKTMLTYEYLIIENINIIWKWKILVKFNLFFCFN